MSGLDRRRKDAGSVGNIPRGFKYVRKHLRVNRTGHAGILTAQWLIPVIRSWVKVHFDGEKNSRTDLLTQDL